MTDLILVQEHRGDPDGLVICHLPYGPTAYFTISGTVMRHDIPGLGTASQQYPHLVFHNFQSKLGHRVSYHDFLYLICINLCEIIFLHLPCCLFAPFQVQSILKYLFPVPKSDSKRVVSFANHDDYIAVRHHVYKKGEKQDIEIKELGPRFQLKCKSLN